MKLEAILSAPFPSEMRLAPEAAPAVSPRGLRHESWLAAYQAAADFFDRKLRDRKP